MKIGEALRLIRVLNNLTQKDLAQELGISDSYVSEVERGNREPSFTVVQKYAEFFKLPVSSIILFAESVTESDDKNSGRKVVSDRLLSLMRLAAGEKDS